MKIKENLINNPSDKEFEFLMKYIEETNLEMRHLEETRDKISTILVAIIGAILSFITISQSQFYLYSGLFILILCVFGIFFTQKIYQLHNKGQMRLNQWYQLLNVKYEIKDVFYYRDEADRQQNNNFWLNFLKNNVLHNSLWTLFYILLSVIGLFLIFKK